MRRSWERWMLSAACCAAVLAISVIPASAAESPSLVKDIAPGSGSSYPFGFVRFQDKLFFAASDGSRLGADLWSSDGTEDATQLVKASSGSQYGFDPSELTPFAGALYFRATSNLLQDGAELWKSDGTTNGTVLVKDFSTTFGGGSPHDLTVSGEKLFFSAYDGSRYGLWTTDGTEMGTTLLTNLGEGWPTDFNGTLFFVGADERDGWSEIWKSDGTVEGTLRVTDFPPGSSYLEHLTVMGDTLYFTIATDAYGYEIWKTDGTEGGTTLLKDINPGAGHSLPSFLVNVDGTLYFWATDDGVDVELWKSDGTEEGTVQVKDINPDGPSVPFDLPRLELVGMDDGRLFFHAMGSTGTGVELWTSDGTEGGTRIVEDINPGGESSTPTFLTDIGHTLYFLADDGTTGLELWTAGDDGTDAERVTDLNPDSDSFVRSITAPWYGVLDAAVYFGADDGVQGFELRRLSLDAPEDTTPPTISIVSPSDGATYELGAVATADFSCADEGGSELASCAGTAPDGDPIDTASTGTKTFTVTAADGAGNTASASVSYEVVEPAFAFEGFLSPVDNPPTFNVMPAGKGVRVVFRLGGDRGLGVFAPGFPQSRSVACDTAAPSDKVEKAVRISTSRLKYEPKPDRYAYTWATSSPWQGSCRELLLHFVDGTERGALFRFT